mgnify:CR=1 FL=1
MSRRALLQRSLSGCGSRRRPRVFVETGTYRGDLVLDIRDYFAAIHTIELSPKWFAYSAERLRGVPHVTCHLGDSASLLEELAEVVAEPAVFYLDAHFAGGDTAYGVDEVPLLRELTALNGRIWKDIIVIDDVGLIGRKGVSGKPGHPRYPTMEFDWSQLSLDAVRRALAGRARVYWSERENHVIVHTNLTLSEVALTRTRVWLFDRTVVLRHRMAVVATLVRTESPWRWGSGLIELLQKRRRRRRP